MSKNYIGMKQAVEKMSTDFFSLLFPTFFGDPNREMTKQLFQESIHSCLTFTIADTSTINNLSHQLMDKIEDIAKIIDTDIQAAFDYDPAAKSKDEIILTYPGFKAISIYRLAHEFYNLTVPIIPRMLTEEMHSLTGIDIHPGAKIGPYFFIDHGTGIVIGETTIIGKHVKLYQNVTLGVKNFELAEDGTLLKHGKRHPNISDGVTIYAGATVLGGNTTIGKNTIIGSGTWIIKSVPEETIVVNKNSTY
ncbi:serine O-acetyltransferase EpsC [Vagococcus sp. JNUCC 83]